MISQLLAWLADPNVDRGISFLQPDGTWRKLTYAELAELTHAASGGLVRHGMDPGSVVSIVARSGPSFVATLFGVLAAGGTASPIAPPLAFRDRVRYGAHVASLLDAAGSSWVVADTDLIETLTPIIAELHAAQPGRSVKLIAIETLLSAGASDGHSFTVQPPAELALVQFTSGSSGTARGVHVSFAALESNVAAIQGWLEMGVDDATAAWLPVHHDMGLVGCLLTPMVNRSDIWLMQPQQFVQRPLTYLECFGRSGARLSAMPNFGLAYIARRVRAHQLQGMDFSQWRAVIVGAERPDAADFDAFCTLLAPYGLNRRALLPAYGLAEATLAVTGLALDETYRVLDVRADSLVFGDIVVPAEQTGSAETVRLVGCGRPLGATTVRVHDEKGVTLDGGEIGEIVVGGTSVTAGYAAAHGLSPFASGGLATGDAGFFANGQLYVLGRLGDSMKIRGRTVFAEDIEAALADNGVPALRVAALLGQVRGRARVVALFEKADEAWLAAARKVLAALTEGAEIVLMDGPRGVIARTTSGKPRRRVLWRLYVSGKLAAVEIGASEPDPQSKSGSGSPLPDAGLPQRQLTTAPTRTN